MGVDPEQIADWKGRYGEVFSVDEYVFRALTIGEHEELNRHRDWSTADAEDYIVNTVLLYPTITSLDTLQAGIVSVISEEVLNISGYGDVKYALKAMESAREKAEGVINLMKAFIIAAMPAYTDDSLNGFSFKQLAEKVSLAEKIIEVQRTGIRLDLIDPEEQAAEQTQKLRREQAVKKAGQATSVDPIAQRLHQALGDI